AAVHGARLPDLPDRAGRRRRERRGLLGRHVPAGDRRHADLAHRAVGETAARHEPERLVVAADAGRRLPVLPRALLHPRHERTEPLRLATGFANLAEIGLGKIVPGMGAVTVSRLSTIPAGHESAY